MIKLELSHVFQTKADGTTDYHNPMVPFDYSNLREEAREEVVSPHGFKRTMVTFGRGLTLEYASHYLGDGDSTGSVAVWDPIKKQPRWFGLGYEPCHVDLLEYDATPEVKAEYEAWKKAQELERLHQAAIYEDQERTAEIEAAKTRPSRGRTVRVIKGRKAPIGTVAQVFWYGVTEGRFGGVRVGIEFTDEYAGRIRVFMSAENVEVVDGAAV